MSCHSKEKLESMLEDVVNELDLSEFAIEEHVSWGTPPAELVRLVLAQKDKTIQMLKAGLVDCSCGEAWFHAVSGEVVEMDVVEWYGRLDVLQEFKEHFTDLDLTELPKEKWVKFTIEYHFDTNDGEIHLGTPKQNASIKP